MLIQARFGGLSDDAGARLQSITPKETFDALLPFAGECKSKEDFVQRLIQLTTPADKPKSTRGKRKS